MDWFVIEGAPPWDGRYDLDAEQAPLTIREWQWIRTHSGYLPLTAVDGFAGHDPALFAVLALIAIRRAGRISTDEVDDMYTRFLDEPRLRVTLNSDEVADADPSRGKTNGNTSSSGDASTARSERSTSPPGRSGIREPASSVSGPTT